MDLFNIAVDPDKEVYGAEVDVDGETTLIIARFNNPKFRKLQAKLMEPYIRAEGRKGVTTEQAEDILSRCLAKTVLLGWKGLKLNGSDVPYSEEKALEILSDPRFADFKEMVVTQAQIQSNYRLEAMEDDLGNSGPSSTTRVAGQKNGKSSSKGSKKKRVSGGRRRQNGPDSIHT